jgi:DNA-binding Lrp family transcriptional regulator
MPAIEELMLTYGSIEEFASSVGLSPGDVLNAMEAAKRKKILKNHKHNIWQNEKTGLLLIRTVSRIDDCVLHGYFNTSPMAESVIFLYALDLSLG